MNKVSIVMCTYNGATFLREQLDSIFRQTHPADEIIIQDDSSTDSTIEIIKEYAQYPIRLYQNKERLGYDRNFTSALLKATGDYILISDQDDIWADNKIETLLTNIGEYSLIFHNSLLFKEIEYPLRTRHTGIPTTYPPFITIKPYIPGHEIMFRKEALSYLKQLEQYEFSYDYILSTICANLKGAKFLNASLTYWRRHTNAATFVPDSQHSRIAGYIKALVSLTNRAHRKTAHNYFTLLKRLPVNDPTSKSIIARMSTGSIIDIFSTCFTCMKQHHRFYPASGKATGILRSFFLPMIFIRDYSKFILK